MPRPNPTGIFQRSLLGALACACLIFAGLAVPAGQARESVRPPEPDPIPRRWELDVKVGPLRLETVTDRLGNFRVYAYMTYMVTNNSGTDLLFAPSFEMATDEGQLGRSGRGVPSEVTAQLIASQENELLMDQNSIIGPLLQGEENAREGLVVWPLEDLNVGEIQVYLAGFSGETKTIQVYDPGTKTRLPMVLRKTLQMRYPINGELDPKDSTPLEPVEPRGKWILR